MSSLKIAIIGGSIAGCAAAITLQRLQHEAMVFEQFTGELESRGAGICIDRELYHQLMAQNYVDSDMPYSELKSRPFFDGLSGRLLWDQPINALAIHWGILYKNLRQRVINESYQQSAKITKITQKPDYVTITVNNDREFEVDLLICCDGFYSLGQRFLFPDQNVQSAGGDMVRKTAKLFIQHIYEISLADLRKNRILLLGDAGILARPHVASGTTKALDAAVSLGAILKQKNH